MISMLSWGCNHWISSEVLWSTLRKDICVSQIACLSLLAPMVISSLHLSKKDAFTPCRKLYWFPWVFQPLDCCVDAPLHGLNGIHITMIKSEHLFFNYHEFHYIYCCTFLINKYGNILFNTFKQLKNPFFECPWIFLHGILDRCSLVILTSHKCALWVELYLSSFEYIRVPNYPDPYFLLTISSLVIFYSGDKLIKFSFLLLKSSFDYGRHGILTPEIWVQGF